MNLAATLSADTDIDDGTVAVFADDGTVVISVDNDQCGASAYLTDPALVRNLIAELQFALIAMESVN